MKPILLSCAFFSLLIFLLSCVSKTIPEERFKDSQSLTLATSITPGNANNFSFAMVGDIHSGNGGTGRFPTILAQAQADGAEFLILLGDSVDQGQEIDYQAITAQVAGSFFANKTLYAIGNHDIFYDGWQYYKNYFGPSYYSINIGNSKFITLDTADGGLGPSQTAWLKTELDKTPATNTFILSHYLPVIPDSQFLPIELRYLKFSNNTEAKTLMNLAAKKNVRGWFGGHFHSYAKENYSGVDYVVAGGGGGKRMGHVLDFFYVLVQVTGTQVTYTLKRIP
jgi:predicted phosphodiesterase